MIIPNSGVASIAVASPNSSRPQRRHVLSRAWGRVRWKMAAIIVFTGTSTILMACLAVAALNVVVRRESANVVEKKIQVLVQASRSVAPAILAHVGACAAPPANSGEIKALLAYTEEAFPQARTSLTVEGAERGQSLLPNWLPDTGFAGLVVDRGQIEIRNVLAQQKGTCKGTAIVTLPLGSALAKRLSSADGMEVTSVSPRLFRVHSPNQRVLGTIEGNFMPGVSRPAAVVLTVRNWETGALEDWMAYRVRASYSGTFADAARYI